MADATRRFHKQHQIQIPFPHPKPPADAPYKLAYDKPSAYNVVGSYVSKTMINAQDKVIDMIVQMPRSLFQEKDFQSMRYFYRRAYYIANIAAGIQDKLEIDVDMEFGDLNGNPLLPVLVIHPTSADSTPDDDTVVEADYAIRIVPCAPDAAYAASSPASFDRP